MSVVIKILQFKLEEMISELHDLGMDIGICETKKINLETEYEEKKNSIKELEEEYDHVKNIMGVK